MRANIVESQGVQRVALWMKLAWQTNASVTTAVVVGLRHQHVPSVQQVKAFWRWTSLARTLVAAILVTSCALALWNDSLKLVNFRAMNDLGLVSVLPMGCFIALGGLTLGFALALRGAQERPHPWMLSLYLLALIYMLYATPTLIEQAPRFQVTYWLAGHTEYIMRTGSVDPLLDAYFNWPGFFVLTGMLTSITGLHSVLAFASWASFAYNLMYLPPMYLIYSTATRDQRLIWLGLWFFYITDWVWQDYFSPQGLNLFLYLVIIAILLKWFKTTQAPPKYVANAIALLPRLISAHAWLDMLGSALERVRRQVVAILDACAHPRESFSLAAGKLRALPAALGSMSWRFQLLALVIRDACAHPRETLSLTAGKLRAWLALSDTPLTSEEYRKRVALLVALIAVFALTVYTHPITPFFVLLGVSALVFVGQCTPRWLPFLMAAMIVAWDFTGAATYMAGHLRADLAPFGNLGTVASANVTSRLDAGSAEHHFVAQVRLVMTVVIWGLAILGAALRWRRVSVQTIGGASGSASSLFEHDLTYALLATMPMVMVIVQPYGGEMAMRSYLLSLPLVTFFAAAAFYTPAAGVSIRGFVVTLSARTRAIASASAIPAACLLLLASFMFARYGNERADYITYNELNAVAYLYSVAPPHSLFLSGWSGTPWRYQDLELYDYSSLYPTSDGATLLKAHDIGGIITTVSSNRYPEIYVIITHSQIMQAELFDGVPPSAFAAVEQELLASGEFVSVYSNSDAVVMVYAHPHQATGGAYPDHPFSTTRIARELSQ